MIKGNIGGGGGVNGLHFHGTLIGSLDMVSDLDQRQRLEGRVGVRSVVSSVKLGQWL